MMNRRQFVRRLPALALGSAAPFSLSACGTLLHPERVGQPRCGRLDPAIAALDGVGLLLFVIPGLIAFAVDFYTGAIYLPPEYASNDLEADHEQLVELRVPADELSPRRIETEIFRTTGRRIALEPGAYRVEPLESVAKIDSAAEHLMARRSGDVSHAVIFRAQSD